ncbi:MAG TPA: DUF427 domain-containing protein [Solirubrobacteraceae bacterium]|nr:DUF427 domain-containing protein [Solirubrobacteraceae bacterium]
MTLVLVDVLDLPGDTTATNFEVRAPEHRLLLHGFPRRVRALFAGEVVLDTRRGRLLRETGRLPVLYVPEDDVRADLLDAGDRRTRCPFKGVASYWSLLVGERRAENAVWAYPEPPDEAAWLRGHVAFDWDALDAWFDEDEEVRGHLRDPFHRVDVRESSRHVRVTAHGELVAETRRPKLLSETGLPNRYYVPPEDVRRELLQPSATHTDCPYKGTASYRTLQLGERRIPDAAWLYPEPLEDARKVRGHLCFMGEGVETTVDGERVA